MCNTIQRLTAAENTVLGVQSWVRRVAGRSTIQSGFMVAHFDRIVHRDWNDGGGESIQ